MPTKKRGTAKQQQVRSKLSRAAKEASKQYKLLPANMRTRKRFGELVKKNIRKM